jgi:hypothetical protein
MKGIYMHSESGLVKKEHVMEQKGFEILPKKATTVIWKC